jgi:hypothetical protein
MIARLPNFTPQRTLSSGVQKVYQIGSFDINGFNRENKDDTFLGGVARPVGGLAISEPRMNTLTGTGVGLLPNQTIRVRNTTSSIKLTPMGNSALGYAYQTQVV